MGRAPCCDKANVKKGPWSPEEDAKLRDYIERYGTGGNWIALPQKAGLKRCGKSCRLRWLNYLRPNIKHGEFTDEEDRIICSLFISIGSRWSIIAAQLPGRTDNDIKNYWNTKLKKKFMGMGHHPHQKKQTQTHQPSITVHHHHHHPTALNTPSSSPYQQYSSATDYNPPSSLSFPSLDHESFTNSRTTTLLGNSSNILSSTSSVLTPYGHLCSPVQSYLMFGGTETSCSSSDGSFCNQISHGRDMEYEYGSALNVGGTEKQGIILQKCSYFYNEVEEIQKFMGSNGEGGNGLLEGFLGGADLDCYYSDLEEIKKLISCGNNNTGCNNCFV
ncbi:hypothetical protein Ancab_031839 [Ancistrocladus abbreviatus]